LLLVATAAMKLTIQYCFDQFKRRCIARKHSISSRQSLCRKKAVIYVRARHS